MYGTLLLLPPKDAFEYYSNEKETIHISSYLYITDIIFIILITAFIIGNKNKLQNKT